MNKPTKPQHINAPKFRRNHDGAVQVYAAATSTYRGGQEKALLSIYGGKRGYVWIGSTERGFYCLLPTATLKGALKAAEAP